MLEQFQLKSIKKPNFVYLEEGGFLRERTDLFTFLLHFLDWQQYCSFSRWYSLNTVCNFSFLSWLDVSIEVLF